MEDIFDRVKKYISANEVQKALNFLTWETQLENPQNIELALINKRNVELKDERRKALISEDSFRIETNKLCKSILEFAKNINPKSSELFNFQKNDTVGYIFRDFYFAENRISIFSPYLTIGEIYTILPSTQIKKTIKLGHFADDLFDAYEIFDFNGTLLLTLISEERKGLDAKINSVFIHSNKFIDVYNKLYIGSTLGEVREIYHLSKASPDIDCIILEIEYLGMYIIIEKKQLDNVNWYDDEKKVIVLENLPDNIQVDALNIHWHRLRNK